MFSKAFKYLNMKRLLIGFSLFFVFVISPTVRSQAQIIDIIQQALIAAIKAADIAVQKVQNATLDLQNAQKAVENTLSQLNLTEIGDWEQKFKDLYDEYYTELKQVKTAVSYFQQITGVIAQQQQLMSEYKNAFALVKRDTHFTVTELNYISNVYTGIIQESTKCLDQIVLVLTNFTLEMTDEARLKIIKQASTDIEQCTTDLRKFNNQTAQISLQRSKDQDEINSVKALYGLTQ